MFKAWARLPEGTGFFLLSWYWLKVPIISIFLLLIFYVIGLDLAFRRCKVLPFFST